MPPRESQAEAKHREWRKRLVKHGLK